MFIFTLIFETLNFDISRQVAKGFKRHLPLPQPVLTPRFLIISIVQLFIDLLYISVEMTILLAFIHVCVTTQVKASKQFVSF